MRLSSYLTSNYILIDLEAETIEEAIEKTVEKLATKSEKIKNEEEIIKNTLLERERKMSTAIGDGIAVPHGRIEGFNDFIAAIAILKEPIKMEVAGKKEHEDVKILVFMISDSINNKLILSVMSDFVKLSKDNPELISKLKNVSRASQVLNLFDKTNIELSHDIVAEDMMQENIIPLDPENILKDVEARLIAEDIRGLPVVNKYGEFLGEISDKDLIGYGMPKFPEFEDMDFLTVGAPFKDYLFDKKFVKAEAICKKDERAIINRETSIMEICFLMVNKGLSRLYVLENDNKYVGVINSFDILKRLQKL